MFWLLESHTKRSQRGPRISEFLKKIPIFRSIFFTEIFLPKKFFANFFSLFQKKEPTSVTHHWKNTHNYNLSSEPPSPRVVESCGSVIGATRVLITKNNSNVFSCFCNLELWYFNYNPYFSLTDQVLTFLIIRISSSFCASSSLLQKKEEEHEEERNLNSKGVLRY